MSRHVTKPPPRIWWSWATCTKKTRPHQSLALQPVGRQSRQSVDQRIGSPRLSRSSCIQRRTRFQPSAFETTSANLSWNLSWWTMEHGPLGIGLLQRWCGFGTALTGDPVGHPRRKATTSNSIPLWLRQTSWARVKTWDLHVWKGPTKLIKTVHCQYIAPSVSICLISLHNFKTYVEFMLPRPKTKKFSQPVSLRHSRRVDSQLAPAASPCHWA